METIICARRNNSKKKIIIKYIKIKKEEEK